MVADELHVATKGLSIRLVLIPAKVGIVGLNVNLAPYGADKLKENCQAENRDPNNLAVPSRGIRARTEAQTLL